MSSDFSPGYMDLLRRKDKMMETHTTLEVLVENDILSKKYYFASAALTFNDVAWSPDLRKRFQIASSLTRAVDQASVNLQNADSGPGLEFLRWGTTVYGSEAIIGEKWTDLLSGAEGHETLFTGIIVNAAPDEEFVKFKLVSEPSANIGVGASRRIVPICQAEYKNPFTCGFAGSQMTCNLLLDHPDGCEGRHGGGVNNSLKRAKFMGMVFLSPKSRLLK